jgi:hypothetical protein
MIPSVQGNQDCQRKHLEDDSYMQIMDTVGTFCILVQDKLRMKVKRKEYRKSSRIVAVFFSREIMWVVHNVEILHLYCAQTNVPM